tara:strand:+ start:398 stop:988 length:591 start_codon:yes stop_codon:yes gene_type:complete
MNTFTKDRTLSLLMATFFLSPIAVLNTNSTKAGTYTAICNAEKKEIHKAKYPKPFLTDIDDPVPVIPICGMELVINDKEITDPYQSIPTSRVKSWSVTGESIPDVSGKVAAFVGFGLIGAFSAQPMKHDYQLIIHGYDYEGKKAFINLKFKDDKQPPKLMTELEMLTGLRMGETRTIEEIKKSEKARISNNDEWKW